MQPPIILELLRMLPPAGSSWPVERREVWLTAAECALRLAYHVRHDTGIASLSEARRRVAALENEVDELLDQRGLPPKYRRAAQTEGEGETR